MNQLQIALQYLIPQHFVSRCIGKIADSKNVWVKNALVRFFLNNYKKIDMSEAIIEDPYAYPSFTDFFIRKLKPESRPITQDMVSVVSPADGEIVQIGNVAHHQLLQAKGIYYELSDLFAEDTELCQLFTDGLFATFYLAPHNYHRVHMPVTGRLIRTIYVPGTLFAVNPLATETIPRLYTKNERLICLFETALGSMAIVLVGALVVGAIKTVWKEEIYREKEIKHEKTGETIEIKKGEEISYFKMGSSVIIFFETNKLQWKLAPGEGVLMGQTIAFSIKS